MNRSVWIMDSGADDAEIENGREAAHVVFERYGLTPEHCYVQIVARANGDAHGNREVACWEKAERAAIAACCAGWLRIPEAAHLELG